MTPDTYAAWTERARPLLVRRVHRQGVSERVAEDLVGAVLARWLETCRVLDDDTDAYAVCVRSAVRLAENWKRDQRARTRAADQVAEALSRDVETPATLAERVERQSAVRRAVDDLPPRQRALAWRVLALGESLAAVARDLGMPHRTAWDTLERVKATLRERLAAYR